MDSKLPNQDERRIITLSALGGMLEFYDFIIYGLFTVYFSHQFFPSHNELIIVIQSYFVFFLGYLARPLGGIIFSHIGDEYGRKKVLVITILLMGAAALGIGFLPTYAQIGIASPILLLLLRLTQGLALGGELPSTYVYISETILKKNKAHAFGIVMAGVNSGLLLGILINQVLNHFLTLDQLKAFGWRIPFILGGIICIVSYNIRKKLHETAAFQQIYDKPRFPLFYFLQHYFKQFIVTTSIVALMASLVVVTVVFMPTYLHEIVKVNKHSIQFDMTIMMMVNVIVIYVSGRLAKYVEPENVLKILLLLCIVFIPLGYFLIYKSLFLLGLIIFGVLEGVAAMITPYLIAQLFESKIRLTGVSLCYNIGFTLFGGMAPLIITSSIHINSAIYWTPTIYLLVMGIICGIGLYIHRSLRLPDLR